MLKQDSQQLPHSNLLLQLFHAVLSALPRHLTKIHTWVDQALATHTRAGWVKDPQGALTTLILSRIRLWKMRVILLNLKHCHMVEVGLQDPFKHVGKWSI